VGVQTAASRALVQGQENSVVTDVVVKPVSAQASTVTQLVLSQAAVVDVPKLVTEQATWQSVTV
jgi:hypothetical protein